MSAITVQVPARADHVGVIRSVVAGVGAQHGLSLDAIEDLRLAVDEACGQLLRMSPAGTRLDVEIAWHDDSLEIVVAIDRASKVGPRSSAEEFLTWHILGALTDGATLDDAPGGAAIRFSKSLQSS